MRRFAFKAAVLATPFLIYGTLIAYLDPFDLLPIRGPVPDSIKERTSLLLNPTIWKMLEFRRHPIDNVLLGDSRMEAVQPDSILQLTRERYFNFAYGGASLNEMIDTFWFASRVTRLKHVYIGINFNHWSDYNYTYRTDAFRSLEANPLLYFTNRTVVHAARYIAEALLAGHTPQLNRPRMDRDAYWNEVIGPITAGYYGKQTEPAHYRDELKRMVAYCNSHGIELRIVIFPSHVQLQQRVNDFGLGGAYQHFKADMASLAPTFDFDFANDLTASRENFLDPMHATPAVVGTVVREVWTKAAGHVRRLSEVKRIGEQSATQ
jgi:hypothetical protein